MEFDSRIIILLLWLVYTLFRRGRDLSRSAPGTGRGQRRPRPAGPRSAPRRPGPAVPPDPEAPAPAMRPAMQQMPAARPEAVGGRPSPVVELELEPAGRVPDSVAAEADPGDQAPSKPQAARRPRRLLLDRPVEGIVWQAVLGPPRAQRPWRPRLPGPFPTPPETTPDL
ncbi:MAG TPA: hypothetical protein VK008_00810 [Sphingobacteriaceae bacterium]|nr:hypothetical protein [Sphingobacteriaceae bacterium]